MANEQLINYIKQQLAQGQTNDQIINSLSVNGWQTSDIMSAFNALNSKSSLIPPSRVNPPTFSIDYSQQKKSNKLLIVVLSIFFIFLIGGGIFAYFYFWQSPEMIVNRMFLNLNKIKSLEYQGEAKVEATTGQTGNYTLDFVGKTDTNDPNNAKSSLAMTATINLTDQPIVFGVDVISIDKTVYMELSQAENFPYADLSSMKNQWIKFDSEAITKQFGLQNIQNQIQAAQQKDQLTTDQIMKLELMLAKAKIYKITQTLPDENIEGQNTYHYKYIIDIAAIKAAYNEASKIIQNRSLNQDEIAAFDNNAKYFKDPDGEIWIGKKDLLPYKFKFTVTATADSPTSGTISLATSFKNFNQPIQIEAPTEYKTMEEILNSIFQTNMADLNKDSDNDGLTDQMESFYGTIATNPDTDGDGYKDGEEVQNGYNPAGPGKLPSSNENTLISPKVSLGGECFISADCDAGLHCFKRKCISDEILISKENCIMGSPSACTQKCENCVNGVFQCWGGTTAVLSANNKCLECKADFGCNSGFDCEEYSCVKITQTCSELKGQICSGSDFHSCLNGELFKASDTDFCCTGSCG